VAGDPLSALTSLTGGGGLSNSSSASATSGPSSIGFNQEIGGLNIGGNTQWLWVALAFIAVAVGFLAWKLLT
jgi:hypothetical protein